MPAPHHRCRGRSTGAGTALRSRSVVIALPVVEAFSRPRLLSRAAASPCDPPPFSSFSGAIPVIDAETAGLFRIIFGVLLLAFFASRLVNASWLGATFDLEIEGTFHAAVLDWLRAHPVMVDSPTPWLLVTCAAFTIGLFTRTTYALFIAGVIVWVYVEDLP